jgi:hypothetical protein
MADLKLCTVKSSCGTARVKIGNPPPADPNCGFPVENPGQQGDNFRPTVDSLWTAEKSLKLLA